LSLPPIDIFIRLAGRLNIGFFELALAAAAIGLSGFQSGAALVTVVVVAIEVPQGWNERGATDA